ncbi:hypothetical protein [Bradyrhizobium tropiciagri]|uniref:hypothetical protein n=1 Tax=Bradyrhizobium tropiciagri TaxID=312253 RepID=UPI001BA46FA3|nr:hypothetical protein [Bradyrhizobium tropiciagri]
MTIMGQGSDRFWRVCRAGLPAGARKWLHHRLEAADGDLAFKVLVVTGGMLSTVAIAFGLLSS